MTRCGPQPWMCWSSRGGRGPCATRSFRPTTLPSTAAHPRRRLAVRLGQPPILFQARGAALRAITGHACEKNRPTYLEICSNVRPARCGPSPCGGMPRSTKQTRLAIVHASPPPPAGGCHPDKRRESANVSLRLSLGTPPTGLKQNVGEMAASESGASVRHYSALDHSARPVVPRASVVSGRDAQQELQRDVRPPARPPPRGRSYKSAPPPAHTPARRQRRLLRSSTGKAAQERGCLRCHSHARLRL